MAGNPDPALTTTFISGPFQLQANQTGTVQMVLASVNPVQSNTEYVYYYILRNHQNTPVGTPNLWYDIAAYVTETVPAPGTSTLIGTNGSGISLRLNQLSSVILPINLTWLLTDVVVSRERYQVVLPPLRTKSIVQSTPKFVMYLMKSTSGWYQVNRVFQPVFNMQQADTQRHIRFALAGSTGSDSSEFTSLGGIVDTYDINFSTGVVVMSGMSYTASPTFKFISDVEVVADEGSPWQTNMMETSAKSDQIVAVARTVMDSQPFLYPEYYNSMGTIINGLSSLLGGLPIVSNVLPLVGKFMSSVMGQPTCEPNSQGVHENVTDTDVGGLVRSLLSKLVGALK